MGRRRPCVGGSIANGIILFTILSLPRSRLHSFTSIASVIKSIIAHRISRFFRSLPFAGLAL